MYMYVHTCAHTHKQIHTYTYIQHAYVHMFKVKLMVTADSNTADHTLINILNYILGEHRKAFGYQNYSQSHLPNT